MPYSDSSTTVTAPSARAASSSGAERGVHLARGGDGLGRVRPEPLQVVVQVRDVDQRQVGSSPVRNVRRAAATIHFEDAIEAVGPQ